MIILSLIALLFLLLIANFVEMYHVNELMHTFKLCLVFSFCIHIVVKKLTILP